MTQKDEKQKKIQNDILNAGGKLWGKNQDRIYINNRDVFIAFAKDNNIPFEFVGGIHPAIKRINFENKTWYDIKENKFCSKKPTIQTYFDSYVNPIIAKAYRVKILKTQEYNANHFGCGRYLTILGGSTALSNEDFGLGDWQFEIKVRVTNQKDETRDFLLVFQPKERNNRLKAYSGFGVELATACDDDTSNELEKFCDYDDSVFEAPFEIAEKAAKFEYQRLMAMLDSGEIKPTLD